MGVPNEIEAESPRLSARAKAVLFFLALAVRLVAMAELSGSAWNEVLLGDARHFDEWGQRIAAGDWRGDGVFYQAPLYAYFLGGVYALCGHAPGLVRLIQCLLAAQAAVWIAGGTRRFASHRAALCAGTLAALFSPAIWYDLQIEKTSLAWSLTALLFYLSVSRRRAEGVGSSWAGGIALACLALLRENAAILALPLAWAFGREARGRARRLAAFALGVGLILLPVALRNHSLGGAFLPTASNAGVNFYIGNGAEADGQYRPLVPGRGHPDSEREDATRIAQDLSGRSLSPAEVSRFWFGLARGEIREEPGHFARLLLHKARLLAHHAEIMDAVAFEVFQDESRLLWALGPFSFGLVFPLLLAGIAVAWRRRDARLTLAGVALLALSIVAFFVVGRFRLGLVPLALPFAGIAFAEGPSSTRRGLAIGCFVLGLAISWWPMTSNGDTRATSAANMASELTRRGDHAGAAEWARDACERDPGSADAAFNLALSLRHLGQAGEAAQWFEVALELEPAYAADCLAELGALCAIAGDLPGAHARLSEALALDPQHPVATRYMERLQAEMRSE